MNACKDEDDCPTPTRCRHLWRCPRAESVIRPNEEGSAVARSSLAAGSKAAEDRLAMIAALDAMEDEQWEE